MKTKKIILVVSILLVIIGITAILSTWVSDGVPEELRIQSMNYYFRDNTRVLSIDISPFNPWMYEFTVMDVKETHTSHVPWGGFTDYNVKITYDFLKNQEINRKAVVRIYGTPKVQAYSVPRLVSGNTYIMISGELSENETTAYPFIFKKWELDSNKYLYPYSNLETTVLGESEPFAYEEELSIYDENNDKDVIRYLYEQGVQLPQFNYKFELKSFLKTFLVFRQNVLEYNEKNK